jgi:hypothetical protein
MRNLIVTVDANEYGPRIYKKTLSIERAEEGIEWLIIHNGNAPVAAKVLLEGLKTAVQAAKAQ